jgi:hypothetical protein
MERTVEAAQERLASFLDTIPPNECANYFNGAGYTTTARAHVSDRGRMIAFVSRK